MSAENRSTKSRRARWLQLATVTYTVASPVINAWLKRVGQRAQSKGSARVEQENARSGREEVLDRLEGLTEESRERIAEQVKRLRAQASQLEKQSRELRKALRDQARQRRKLLKQMRKAGIDWGQDVLKQGQELTEDVLERGSKVVGEFVERGGKATQDVVERSGKATRKLVKRGRKISQDVVEQGKARLQPDRKRSRNIGALIGFGMGLLIVAIAAYWLVRRRVALQEAEQDQPIELPRGTLQDVMSEGESSRPAGEIRHVGDIGTAVTTMPVVDVEDQLNPQDAPFVGVISTRFYYPSGTELDVLDLVYFNSEEEAQAQGFTPAEQS